jgi:uncharacterized protein (TIGR03435 family)
LVRRHTRIAVTSGNSCSCVEQGNIYGSVKSVIALEKPSPNLVPHADDGTLPVIRVGSTPGERIFENMPIARLAMLLRGETGRTVVDKTGLEGSYDFKVEYASNLSKGPREENSPSELGQSVFAAVRKLGLKLESQKGPSEYLTIEHVEKPSAN